MFLKTSVVLVVCVVWLNHLSLTEIITEETQLSQEKTELENIVTGKENSIKRAECVCKNGECIKDANGTESCNCFPEFGKKSETVCEACKCGPGANCTFEWGLFVDTKKCICPDGTITFARCKGPCETNPCEHEGTCLVNGTTFKCVCKSPFYGETCEKDPCSTLPCKNGGTCQMKASRFECKCKIPYFGETCENDPCQSHPCTNGGTCVINGTSIKCICKPPYIGEFCNAGIQLCDINVCKNGGTCMVSTDGPECMCVYPYGGQTCTESQFCTEGKGPTLCPNGTCRFDFDTEVGRCECPEKQVYNYEKQICEKSPETPSGSSTSTGTKEMTAGLIVLSVLVVALALVSIFLARKSGICLNREGTIGNFFKLSATTTNS